MLKFSKVFIFDAWYIIFVNILYIFLLVCYWDYNNYRYLWLKFKF